MMPTDNDYACDNVVCYNLFASDGRSKGGGGGAMWAIVLNSDLLMRDIGLGSVSVRLSVQHHHHHRSLPLLERSCPNKCSPVRSVLCSTPCSV